LAGAGNGTAYLLRGLNGALYHETTLGGVYANASFVPANTKLAGAGDGTLFAMENDRVYHVPGSGYTFVDSFTSDSLLVGAGNGVGYVLYKNNNRIYRETSSGSEITSGDFVLANTTLVGGGDGTYFALEGSNLYQGSGSGYSRTDWGFEAGSLLFGAGNGTAYLFNANGNLYRETASGGVYVGGLDFANTTMVGAGDGTLWALEGTNLYHVTSSGISGVINTFTAGSKLVGDIGNANAVVPVYWTGIGDTTWSTASGLNNWKDSGGMAADYADGAPVTFDDTATGTTADISAADVSPASVTFDNSAQDFTITGAKGIAGATGVVKQGTGKVTLNGVNTYSGVTTVQAGTLQMSEYSYGNVATNGGADIQGGKGILDYSLSGTSPAPDVQVMLTASYNNGAWDVGQIRNTTAATTGLSVGWADDATAQQLTIMATYAGDANIDGTTDVADLTALLNNYNKTSMVWANGDFNYDGTVNVADLTALLNNYNKSVAAAALSSNAVPEPGALILLATSLLGLLAYAWRKRK
jgi:autotransporter-associated beta strand protein